MDFEGFHHHCSVVIAASNRSGMHDLLPHTCLPHIDHMRRLNIDLGLSRILILNMLFDLCKILSRAACVELHYQREVALATHYPTHYLGTQVV